MRVINAIVNLSRTQKKIIFVWHDFIIIAAAFWLALAIRLPFSIELNKTSNWLLFGVTSILTIGLFINLGLYRAVIRYAGSKMLLTCFSGSIISTLILVLTAFFTHSELPRSIPLMYFLISSISFTGSRLIIKELISASGKGIGQPVLIYGAGQSGRQLLEALKYMDEYHPVAFIDDNPDLYRSIIQNYTVYSPNNLLSLINKNSIKKILLAIPSASNEERQRILNLLTAMPCEVLTIPGMKDLVDGSVTIDVLKPVSVIDLLGRSPIAPKDELMSANIHQQIVMVTGAGGSIGSELCRQIILAQPKTLLLFEISEFALYQIDKELRERVEKKGFILEIIPLLGSVQNQQQLTNIMTTFKVNTIYHAAAYKHVPMVEFNMLEGIRNNIFGTLNCAQAAIAANVNKFVLISTDKAVRPTNTMGASKRMAELVLQALSENSNQTRFVMVRFGNVLGSSGSVVPLFEKQIKQGGPITLTHPEITRFFMTIPEAAQLVIQAGALGQGGDVFVLDMGQSVKIMDLAKKMILLSGLEIKDINNPNGDIEIKITGLRPGEKLYEELLIGDNVTASEHPRIMTAKEDMLNWDSLEPLLKKLDGACLNQQYEIARAILLEAPTGFKPKDGICDLQWQQSHHH